MSAQRQRIDKWLWHARVVRTREAAAALAAAGYVRINGTRVEALAAPVRCGDVVTIALDHGVRVLRVCGFAPRRGDAGEARRLFEDLAQSGAASYIPASAQIPRGLHGLRLHGPCSCASTPGTEA